MHVSLEGNTYYCFCWLDNDSVMNTQQFYLGSDANAVPCDQLSQNIWDVCKGGCFDSIYNHVDWKIGVSLRKRNKGSRQHRNN